MGKQDHPLLGVVCPLTLDFHRSDIGDAIYAKIEKSIYRGAGIARPYITTYIRAPGMGKQDHPLPLVICPQTLDLHRSDVGDAIYAKVEQTIYRGAGIARPYITTYIWAPGMGKQDHPLPGVVCPKLWISIDLNSGTLYMQKSIYRAAGIAVT